MRRLAIVSAAVAGVVIWSAGLRGAAPGQVPLPLAVGSVRFAVIGDNGDGSQAQREVGAQMARIRLAFPFEFVVMLGDNMYGGQAPRDFVAKFEQPYGALLDAGVTFHATLGNHDDPKQVDYAPFNMGGERYRTFVRGAVRFFVLDSNLLDRRQLAWFEEALRQSGDEWRIVTFHHPIYSNANKYGSNMELRAILEPILERYAVDVALSGHEHVYERHKPQRGVTYFTEGSSGKLRRGDMRPGATTAAAFDEDQTFMVVEVAGGEMTFQTISRTGQVVDAGVIRMRPKTLAEGQR